jgi:hypothetical protein
MAGRRRGCTEICPNVLTKEEILNEAPWKFDSLSLAIWLAKHCLIKNHYDFERCGNRCILSVYSQGSDGHRWACRGCSFFRVAIYHYERFYL